MLKNCILGIYILTIALVLSSCSSDDDSDNRNCENCDLQGQNVEICDNEDGTYTVTAAGQSETITEEELEGVTPEEYIELICSLGNLIP